MRKPTYILAAIALTFGPTLTWAADQPSAAQPGTTAAQPGSTGNAAQPGTTGNAAYNAGTPSSVGASASAQTPPADWTSLQGTVQAVDASAKTVQIQDTTGTLIQIPVDRQVSIKKDGKAVQLSQIQTGDSILIAKRTPSAQEKKSSAY